MGCCPRGIFIPLVKDCTRRMVPMPHGGLLRVGDSLVGESIEYVDYDTLLTTNAIVLVDTTNGNVTIDLPPAEKGIHFVIKKTDNSANTVIIDAAGSETIDGSTTKTLPNQYDSIRIVSDSVEWWVI